MHLFFLKQLIRMRIQDHIIKLSWIVADKTLFILYGFVHFYQIRQITPEQYGLFAELLALHGFIFGISDGFALQGIIKFGADPNKRGSINRMALLSHISISIGLPCIIYILQTPLALLLSQPDFTHIATYLLLYSFISLPRFYCIKFLSRDFRIKGMFFINLLWFGTMTALTVFLVYQKEINSFEDLIIISFIGMAMSSTGALVLAWNSIEKLVIDKVTFREILAFGGYQVSSLTISNVVRLLDVMIIEYFFTTTVVGVYSSSKQLFRVFDQLFEAIAGLLYTGGVRLIHQQRREELTALVSKATSFAFLAMILIIIPLELGFADFLITNLLSQKYITAIGYFKLLLLIAPVLPFAVLSLILVSYDKSQLLLRFIMISTLISLAALLIVSFTNLEYLIPVGLIVYYFVLGALCYSFVYKELGLSPRMLLRAVPDSIQFVKQFISKRRGSSL